MNDIYNAEPRLLHMAVDAQQYLLVKKLLEMKMAVNA